MRSRFRGRRNTFARYGAEFDAGAAFLQAVKNNIQRYKHEETGRQQRERERARKKEERKKERKKERKNKREREMLRGSDDSAKGALSFVYILKISGGVGGGGSPPP